MVLLVSLMLPNNRLYGKFASVEQMKDKILQLIKLFWNIFAAHADFHTDPLMGLLHNNPELADALTANWC